MGGIISTKKKDDKLPLIDINNKTYKDIINEKCPMIRLDPYNCTQIFNITGINYNYRLRYCYVSQRGYYPTSLNKANQDSYSIQESWYNNESIHMFGIYDGHGEYGDHCSHFAAQMTPLYLQKEIDTIGGLPVILENDTSKFQKAYTSAFTLTNRALHASSIDDSLSGTTAVTVFVRGDKLIVANVGDSRAIIASEINGNLKFSPLSFDQTPFRKDERVRLKKKGAKIMTMDQIEGSEPIHENWGEGGETGNEIGEGDPPRVWDSSLQMPGCAFTRSIGDAMAESIGVFAEPEILVWDIQPNDKFVIIASDGVFEFLTSQAVVHMIAGFDDMLAAAKHVVAEAYRLWLTFDDRTDDITIIIMSFEDIRKKYINDTLDSQNEIRHADMDYQKSVKPIRKTIRRKDRKKKLVPNNLETIDDTDVDFIANSTEKSQSELARIKELVNSNFMFSKLTQVQKELLYKVMIAYDVKKDEIIIKEGDNGDEMFIIDFGEYDVYKNDESKQLVLVFTYTSGAFGELSLIYGEPRAATVKAKTDGKLWRIGRRVFKAIMTDHHKLDSPFSYLKSIPIFSDCTSYQIQRVSEYSVELVLSSGEIVIEYGKTPQYDLYIIVSGSVQLQFVNGDTVSREVNTFFGAFELGQGTKCIKRVTCKGEVKMIGIPKIAISNVLGNDILLSLQSAVTRDKGNFNLMVKSNIFSKNGSKKINSSEYKLISPTQKIGDYAYVAAYENVQTKSIVSIKVVGKKRSNTSELDKFLIQEKKYLMALSLNNDSDSYISTIFGTSSTDKITMLFFNDHFVSDLTYLIYQTDIPTSTKLSFSINIYLGIKYLHGKGLFHRFINPDNIYIDSNGVAKVGGLLYATEMKGKKNYTIVGEAEYFAPEIILQQGYNYGIDLWAYGILLFELFEGKLPFGQENIDEVSLYKLITLYQPGNLQYSIKDNKTIDFINSILQPISTERLGFKSSKDILKSDFFKGIKENEGKQLSSSFPKIDASSLFIHSEQESVISPLYDNF